MMLTTVAPSSLSITAKKLLRRGTHRSESTPSPDAAAAAPRRASTPRRRRTAAATTSAVTSAKEAIGRGTAEGVLLGNIEPAVLTELPGDPEIPHLHSNHLPVYLYETTIDVAGHPVKLVGDGPNSPHPQVPPPPFKLEETLFQCRLWPPTYRTCCVVNRVCR